MDVLEFQDSQGTLHRVVTRQYWEKEDRKSQPALRREGEILMPSDLGRGTRA